jgi:Zn-dependent M28 family amino/carboxypeptidase
MNHRSSAAIALAAAVLLSIVPVAFADDDGGSTRGLRKAVSTKEINQHLRAFQTHSTLGGNRVASSPGFQASADYVEAKLRRAGYEVTRDPFEFVFNADIETPVFTVQGGRSYVDGNEFSSMTFSPNGDETAAIYAVDVVAPGTGPGNLSTSGCEAADFAGFPPGAIALVQRGTCPFAQKAQNAAAAGAVATIVFNEGQPGRTDVINGTLGGPQSHSAQTIGTSFAVGNELSNGLQNGDTGKVVRLKVQRINETRTTQNVIAELPKGGLDDDGDDHGDRRRSSSPSNVLVVGAHLDSVPRGPGINDNGSGSASILEVAEQMARREVEPRTTVRFMWYSAEEFGLLGSEAYVAELPAEEQARIKAMLNFDMVASPNYVRFVYDGDNSAYPVGPGAALGPAGSGEIEAIFANYFSSQGLESAPTPFSGRSDYGPFIDVGIPAGGLFTGAEGAKTAEQAQVYGGQAGVAYDQCYHLACDTFANVNQVALDQMSDAVAHTTLTLSKRDFDRRPLVNPAPLPAGPGDGGGGGLLHPAHDADAA